MIDEGPDNDDRADRVSMFVLQSARDRYWGGEYIETVVADIVSDLLHFLDRSDGYLVGDPSLSHIHRDPEPPAWSNLVDNAVERYQEEVDEEAWEKENGDEEAVPVL